MSRVPAEQRREQLIEATIALAIDEGLAAASVRRIAEKANVSLGVVHYCFSSKEALINAVAEAFITPILGPIGEALQGAGDESIEDKSRLAFRTFWKLTRRSPGRQLLSYELAAWSIRGDGVAAKLLYKTYLDAIEVFLTDGIGIVGSDALPTRTLARMVLSVADGVMLSWLVDRDDEATEGALQAFVSVLIDIVQRGLDSGAIGRND